MAAPRVPFNVTGLNIEVPADGQREVTFSVATGVLDDTWTVEIAGTTVAEGDGTDSFVAVFPASADGQRWQLSHEGIERVAGVVIPRPLRNALDLTTLELTVDDGGTVIDIEVDAVGPVGHGDLAGRDAPGSHPAAAVAVDPADVPFLDPAAFAATVEAQSIAHGAPPESAASIAASITALVVDQLVEPVTVLAALQDAGALSTAALGQAWGASAGLDAHAASTTGAHGGIVSATDARLTDARTPSAHAASHGSGGSDPVSPAAIGAAAVAHEHDGAAITSGTITPARLGTGSPAADRVLTGDGAWSPLPTAMGAWTPLPDTVYPSPADLGGHDGLTALPTGTPPIGETWWSWRDAQGPWAIAQIGLSISALGASPSAFRLHVHSRSTSGRPGTRLWVAPATITPTATGILWLTLAAPLVVPAWTVFGVGVQCVSGGTTVLHVTPRRQEPTAPIAAVATNNTYRWLSTGTTTPLGDSPPVSIGTAAPAKVLIRTAA